MKHLAYTDCWCRPRVDNVDGVGVIVKHRDLRPQDVEAYRVFYTHDGSFAWESDQPFIHVYPDE